MPPAGSLGSYSVLDAAAVLLPDDPFVADADASVPEAAAPELCAAVLCGEPDLPVVAVVVLPVVAVVLSVAVVVALLVAVAGAEMSVTQSLFISKIYTHYHPVVCAAGLLCLVTPCCRRS